MKGRKKQMQIQKSDWLVIRGHSMLMQHKETVNGKLQMAALDHGTIDCKPENVRKLRRGDIICYGGTLKQYEVLVERQDGYYLIVDKDNPAVSYYLSPAYRLELKSEF